MRCTLKWVYAEFHESLTKENFEMFLAELKVCRKSISSFKHNGNQKILDDLDKAIEEFLGTDYLI